MLYNQGVLNKKQFYDNLKNIDEKLIQEMKNLKKKSLSYVDGVSILEDASKIVQLNKNIQELERVIGNAIYYDRNEDADFIAVNGNYEEALNLKRARAETNLVLYKILYQVSKRENLTSE